MNITSHIIRQAAAEVEDTVINLRRHIHKRPELGLQEHETAALAAEELAKLPVSVTTGIRETGISALLRGNPQLREPVEKQSFPPEDLHNHKNRGKTILLRADMDALPIQEETGLPYSSEIPGVMHACGHDGHTAILLGAAMVLSRFREVLPGNVKFIFQPAEEKQGGAEEMIKAGVLRDPKVDAALGLHLWGSTPQGIVEYRPGPFMASPDFFTLRIIGRGGHAAMPHSCIDPIPIAAAVISQFQTIISRLKDPLEPAVISVCKVEAGNAHNVIPSDAVLQGTVRSLSPETRKELPALMEKTVKQITALYGADYRFDYTFRFPPLINNPEMTGLVRTAAEKMLGPDRVREALKPNMGGEDFAYFAEAVPSAFFYLGIAPGPGEAVFHHHPQFQFDDRVLTDGVAVLCQSVFDYFNVQAREPARGMEEQGYHYSH